MTYYNILTTHPPCNVLLLLICYHNYKNYHDFIYKFIISMLHENLTNISTHAHTYMHTHTQCLTISLYGSKYLATCN